MKEQSRWMNDPRKILRLIMKKLYQGEYLLQSMKKMNKFHPVEYLKEERRKKSHQATSLETQHEE